jgi:hypothetical protein
MGKSRFEYGFEFAEKIESEIVKIGFRGLIKDSAEAIPVHFQQLSQFSRRIRSHTVFETALAHESGSKGGLFDENNRG